MSRIGIVDARDGAIRSNLTEHQPERNTMKTITTTLALAAAAAVTFASCAPIDDDAATAASPAPEATVAPTTEAPTTTVAPTTVATASTRTDNDAQAWAGQMLPLLDEYQQIADDSVLLATEAFGNPLGITTGMYAADAFAIAERSTDNFKAWKAISVPDALVDADEKLGLAFQAQGLSAIAFTEYMNGGDESKLTEATDLLNDATGYMNEATVMINDLT